MKPTPLFAALLLSLPFAAAADTLYKCADEGGQVLYTNQKGAGKNCTILSQDQPVSTFTPPPRPKAQATPGEFPRVSADRQKARDNDRRAILEQELATEQKQLDEARKALAEQEARIEPNERNVGGSINQAKVQERQKVYRENVQLHERNVEALNRELAGLR